MKTCSTCIYWHKGIDDANNTIADDTLKVIEFMGNCRSPKMIYIGQDSIYKNDSLCYYDYEGAAAGVLTGENFGCIHHKDPDF